MKLFFSYIRQRKTGILYFILFCAIFLLSFFLYRLPLAAAIYPMALCMFTGILFLIVDYGKTMNRHRELMALQRLSASLITTFPTANTIEDEDYQQIIALLCEEQRQLETRMNSRYSDMIDYYTAWAHQIKTPIASMKLTLQNGDYPLSRQLSSDLFRIEQYVEMVMTFLRLDSETTDYVIAEYDLDKIIKGAVKKFSHEFISRKIILEYEPTGERVITDEKWLSFVIEQILSNALKYTKKGKIAIKMETPETLCVYDTGMGIAQEDLPRIFDRGYTGYNGRSDKRASGIGLYLCRRICRNLGHDIKAESQVGEGTVIKIDLSHIELKRE